MNAIMMLHRAQAGYLAAQGGGGGSKYIEFADPAVEAVLLAKGIGDGIGITTADVEKVTSIGTWFKGNTAIKYFDEFEKFTGITTIGSSAVSPAYAPFMDCTALTGISFPPSLTAIQNYSFQRCTSLTSVKGLDRIVTFGSAVFNGCSSLGGALVLPKCEKLTQFQSTAISRVLDLGKITSMDGITSSYAGAYFDNCSNLEVIITPSTLTSIAARAIGRCSALKCIIFKATTPPTIPQSLPPAIMPVRSSIFPVITVVTA